MSVEWWDDSELDETEEKILSIAAMHESTASLLRLSRESGSASITKGAKASRKKRRKTGAKGDRSIKDETSRREQSSAVISPYQDQEEFVVEEPLASRETMQDCSSLAQIFEVSGTSAQDPAAVEAVAEKLVANLAESMATQVSKELLKPDEPAGKKTDGHLPCEVEQASTAASSPVEDMGNSTCNSSSPVESNGGSCILEGVPPPPPGAGASTLSESPVRNSLILSIKQDCEQVRRQNQSQYDEQPKTSPLTQEQLSRSPIMCSGGRVSNTALESVSVPAGMSSAAATAGGSISPESASSGTLRPVLSLPRVEELGPVICAYNTSTSKCEGAVPLDKSPNLARLVAVETSQENQNPVATGTVDATTTGTSNAQSKQQHSGSTSKNGPGGPGLNKGTTTGGLPTPTAAALPHSNSRLSLDERRKIIEESGARKKRCCLFGCS
ncbi:unnamed protein product [Amoebophrya sp. A25]|nr:unnamed protein product [Amoebophrya sp. A25]|eukprot:GSA25T00009569001.1